MADDLIIGSGSSRPIWVTSSFRESTEESDEEENLRRAGIIRQVTGDAEGNEDAGKLTNSGIVLDKLGMKERKVLLDKIFKVVEKDNEKFLKRLRQRIDRVGLELPTVEVRYENLSIEADAYVGSRALPTLWNASINFAEGIIGSLLSSKKKTIKIVDDVSGILRPSRMTLLLGPQASGKSTLMMALAGKFDKNLRVSGRITYCGHELSEFYPQRTSAYISQYDLLNGEMTVRETLDFSGRCLGVGNRYEMLSELSRRERYAGIKPDPEIDAFMKATAMEGQKTNIGTDYILKMLGLDICADIQVGDVMRRGISGGEKKRVTTGEMLAGPARALFMDEISTGLDSSTTFQIVKFIWQMVHVMDGTVMISLLQPAPETFNLFDDVILFSEGQVVYHGPRENILEFFESVGFRCPERKGVADFLQEVISKKDQGQYWVNMTQPYRYISVGEFAQYFKSFRIGCQLMEDLKIPYDKSKAHPAALITEKYDLSNWELLKATTSREWLLMKRNSFVYIFKTSQITILSLICMTVFFRTEMHCGIIPDGNKFVGALFFSLLNVMFNGLAELSLTVMKLPVFYKQRDLLFFPPWAYGLSYWILKIPLSLLESGIWTILTYYVIGFAPSAGRFFRQLLAYFFVHQMSLSLFRLIGSVGRTMVISNTIGMFLLLVVFCLSGFVISKDDIQPWWIWAYWISPMMYGQNAIAINEFLDPRWGAPNYDKNIDAPTVGKAILRSRGLFVDGYWYWIAIGALVGFSILFNVLFIMALTYLNPIESAQTTIAEEDKKKSTASSTPVISVAGVAGAVGRNNTDVDMGKNGAARRGMVLPFQPLSLAFNHVNYYVDMPVEMKSQGIEQNRLQLLSEVSGAFRPGVLTALVGVTGAGKTTLMDVLAGRKTGGYIEGDIWISGYPKRQETFARVSGYCEQNDIHSPNLTVHESLVYSAWLRLATEIDEKTRKMFVKEVMELVELNALRDALVGRPGVDGLSSERRKRLTIAVELVANPSIIFMDEPTSGLDARSAAIVMRTVRNTVNTGRTVVCTIHQPSIDIFESFDELLLMKKGGQVIYAGALGRQSHKLIEYFEEIPRVPKITEGYNPATWMLEITSSSVEASLNLDFAEVYAHSPLYQTNQDLIKAFSIPAPGSKDLSFPTKYSQSFTTQYIANFWKQRWSYWRNPQYNAVRFCMTIVIGILFGTMFWRKAEKTSTQQDLLNLLGAIYSSVFFLGCSNALTVQPVVDFERTVFYREKAAGMYSPLAYAFAQVSVEIIYIAIQTLAYSLLLFSLIGFSWRVGKFLYFLYFMFMCFTYFTMYGMMAVALTPNYQIAGVVSSFFYSIWNLFSGFLITRPDIPIWWRWYYWLDPAAWSIYGIVVSQLADLENLVTIPGAPTLTVNEFLSQNLGFDCGLVNYVVLVHLAFVLVFFFTFAYAIKYLNFQKR